MKAADRHAANLAAFLALSVMAGACSGYAVGQLVTSQIAALQERQEREFAARRRKTPPVCVGTCPDWIEQEASR